MHNSELIKKSKVISGGPREFGNPAPDVASTVLLMGVYVSTCCSALDIWVIVSFSLTYNYKCYNINGTNFYCTMYCTKYPMPIYVSLTIPKTNYNTNDEKMINLDKRSDICM